MNIQTNYHNPIKRSEYKKQWYQDNKARLLAKQKAYDNQRIKPPKPKCPTCGK